ncbi:MAG TPA: 2-amino-4-hydroxy-6-hydroxymethyldihydropteridine diphosphokinase, partial [Longimicrobiales bacterium]|nr:2-amino-4-hydroxy-6-hydroxymethyldihydropteridine diphosphokinase [Longimicrobiales bacterium]
MARVLLGLGTNVGDRAAHLRAALMALRNVVAIRALSDVYESEPYGHADQGRFWNMAVAADTDAAPDALLHTLQALEVQLGRVRTFRMGPRVIDIDILFC